MNHPFWGTSIIGNTQFEPQQKQVERKQVEDVKDVKVCEGFVSWNLLT